MATMRLTAVVINTARRYTLSLSEREPVGGVAAYFSQHEDAIDARTLELARPLALGQRLADIDIQSGDRLLVFSKAPDNTEMPPPLNPGDKVLNFAAGDMVLSSRGKKRLVLGKPDESAQMVPDIDLRNFVSPRYINFVSRESLKLDFDDARKTWYAVRTGRTRVMIDELELGTDRIALNNNFVMRLFKGSDMPGAVGVTPIGEIRVGVETVESRGDIVYLATGGYPLTVQAGIEKDTLRINASANLTFDKISEGLLKHYGMALTAETRVYLTRLLAPSTRLSELQMSNDEFLYVARRTVFTQNVLVLRNTLDRTQAFELAGGQDQSEKLIGRRSQADAEDPELDVDLYKVIANDGTDRYRKISRRQARVYYRPAENTWWLKLEERTSVPVFLNNTRVIAGTPISLTSGDVLSVGPGVDDFYARLEVEIMSKSE
jgi:hypothetical protein